MKSQAHWLFLATIVAVAPLAIADDTPNDNPVKSPKQKMHECMTKQQADKPGLNAKEARKTCAAMLQTQENHPSKPVPPTNAPQT
jgi:hypothetical protein